MADIDIQSDSNYDTVHARLDAASAMLAALEADDAAFANLIAYLNKHRDRLPPFTTSSIEVRREKLAAAIAAAKAAGIKTEGAKLT